MSRVPCKSLNRTMTEMRSAKIMNGRVFAGARALYRAAGVKGDDMGKKPIIAIANSFDEFLDRKSVV